MLVNGETPWDLTCPRRIGAKDTTGCVGTNCMAWRWFDAEFHWGDREQPTPKRRGFCGLCGPIQFEEERI